MKNKPKPKGNQPAANVSSNFPQINQNAAGIDIGSAEHWVCVPTDRTPENVRCFGCFTPDLIAMTDWLVECGVDTVAMESTGFPTVKHFSSWLGLCPGSRITGGKVKSSQTRLVVNRAANAFRLAAQSLCRSQSALGAFYRRRLARLGAAKANTAAAHKLARIFYQLWTTKQAYADSGADYYEQKYQQRVVNKLQKTAQSLGFQLVPQTQAVV